MDVRKWIEQKIYTVAPEGLPAIQELRIVDAFTPAITKLVEAFRASARNHHKLMGYVSRRDAYPGKSTEECATKNFENCMNCDCVDARAVLAEIEKE